VDPLWFSDMFGSMVMRCSSKSSRARLVKEGVLQGVDFTRVWRASQFENRHEFILALLLHLKIAFSLADGVDGVELSSSPSTPRSGPSTPRSPHSPPIPRSPLNLQSSSNTDRYGSCCGVVFACHLSLSFRASSSSSSSSSWCMLLHCLCFFCSFLFHVHVLWCAHLSLLSSPLPKF
jgi:hypothetical protein